jgi:hypothetical protein
MSLPCFFSLVRRRDRTSDDGRLLARAFDVMTVNVTDLMRTTTEAYATTVKLQQQRNSLGADDKRRGREDEKIESTRKQEDRSFGKNRRKQANAKKQQRTTPRYSGTIIFSDDKYGLTDPYSYGSRALLWASEQEVIFTASISGYWNVYAAKVQSPFPLRSLNPGANCDMQDYLLSFDRKYAIILLSVIVLL